MKFAAVIFIALTLSVGVALAQDTTTSGSQNSAKQDMKDAGHATETGAKDVGHATKTAGKDVGHATKTAGKDVGHATKTAAKDTGHATKTAGKDVGHATKKVVHSGASKTEEGAEKVKDKTAPLQ